MKKNFTAIWGIASLMMIITACGQFRPRQKDYLRDHANTSLKDITNESVRGKAKKLVVQALEKMDWRLLLPVTVGDRTDEINQYSSFIKTDAKNIVEKADELNPYDFVSLLEFISDLMKKIEEAGGDKDKISEIWKDARIKDDETHQSKKFLAATVNFESALGKAIENSDRRIPIARASSAVFSGIMRILAFNVPD